MSRVTQGYEKGGDEAEPVKARETSGERGRRLSAPQRRGWKGLQEEEVCAKVPSKGKERSAGLVLGTQMSDGGLFRKELGRRWQNDLRAGDNVQRN